ncbi:RluA family pseudouridine synthase [Persephonella atlantica]|uniref:Pseudouridine synthase n=1 Tax=Persephonella atlantica TaxID=2699429 RepID=A0ABS1GEX1_9AQUI|nr:RluA family pseudouridine synthase [Persephonella atlantica]MBK3331488.1 RluA family pseudouridine synthase [Persephonella atlantica]
MEQLSFIVEEKNVRLDQFLAKVYPEYSRSYFQKLIKDGYVEVDEKKATKPSLKLKGGERVSLTIPPPEEIEVKPENIPLEVYYEDEDLAVIYKPPGMVVHPSPGHTSKTLVNALLYHFKNVSQFGGRERAGIVHRLDKDTAGLMVIARSEFAHKELQKQFQSRAVNKKYKAIVTGIIKKDHGFIDFPIGRSVYNRKKMGSVSTNLKEALTEFWTLKRWEEHNLTLVDIKLHTGRTHQIRVHFSEIGHPLLNDRVYGFKTSSLKSQLAKEFSQELNFHALVAYRLSFTHPRTGNTIDIELEKLPEPIEKYIQIFSA